MGSSWQNPRGLQEWKGSRGGEQTRDAETANKQEKKNSGNREEQFKKQTQNWTTQHFISKTKHRELQAGWRQAGVSDGFQTLSSKVKLIQQKKIIFWKIFLFSFITYFIFILALSDRHWKFWKSFWEHDRMITQLVSQTSLFSQKKKKKRVY